jgi:cytochrome c553
MLRFIFILLGDDDIADIAAMVEQSDPAEAKRGDADRKEKVSNELLL